jgi:predicted metalloprotease with PDZ domain
VKIKSVRKGTPADASGVQEGDIVIAINGVNVCNSSHKDWGESKASLNTNYTILILGTSPCARFSNQRDALNSFL